jgi:hypothetical protein
VALVGLLVSVPTTYPFAAAFRLAAQYSLIRSPTALRAAADISRRCGRWEVLALVKRPAPFAKMNDSGSSSRSYESRRCGNSPTSFLASCASSRSWASAPRLARSYKWAFCLRDAGGYLDMARPEIVVPG